MTNLNSLEARVEAIEESQTRHRELLAEMSNSLHKIETQVVVFLARIDTIVGVAKLTLGAIGSIALLVLAALIGRWIKP
jgi:hypothetical protein